MLSFLIFLALIFCLYPQNSSFYVSNNARIISNKNNWSKSKVLKTTKLFSTLEPEKEDDSSLIKNFVNSKTQKSISVITKEGLKSLKGQLEKIIHEIFDFYKLKGDLSSLNPQILIENSHILCKGRYFEELMKDRVKNSSGNDRIIWERISAFLAGFISSERRTRARLKVSYILAGATVKRIDDAINLLEKCEEIDEDLFFCLSSMISSLESTIQGEFEDPLLAFQIFNMTQSDPNNAEARPAALKVLKLIEKRLKAELKLRSSPHTYLLSELLKLSYDPDKRFKYIKDSLKTLEDLDNFIIFIKEGISYIVKTGGKGRESPQSSQIVELSPGTLEHMKDILIDLNAIKDSINDEELQNAINNLS